MKNIKYKPEDINNKNFDIEYKGYKLEEVDSFLDDITADYVLFMEKITALESLSLNQKKEIDSLKTQLETATTSYHNLQINYDKAVKTGTNASDLARRVSELERKGNKD